MVGGCRNKRENQMRPQGSHYGGLADGVGSDSGLQEWETTRSFQLEEWMEKGK